MREWNEEENQRQRELEKVALEHIKKEGASKRAAQQKEMLEKEAAKLAKLGTEAREITATAVTVGLGNRSNTNPSASNKSTNAGCVGNGKSKVDDDEEDDDEDEEIVFEYMSTVKPAEPTENGNGEVMDVATKEDTPEALANENPSRSEASFEEQPKPKRARLEEFEEAQSNEGASEKQAAAEEVENLKKQISASDFSSVKEASDLEALGLDFIKDELLKRGMKCGGRLQERVQRLFLLKHTKLEDLDRKYLAKQAPQK